MLFRRRNKKFYLPDVIDGCKRRRQLDQKELYENYANFAKNICLRYAVNEIEAEEMLSDGFLKIFNNIDKYDTNQSFDAWFRTIMVNSAIDYFRKHHSKVDFTDLDSAKEIHTNDIEFDLISAEEIMAFIQRLTPVYRTVFSLSAVEGYSYKEISEMLGVTESAVRANIFKARTKLQVWISEYMARQTII
ncbi:RNA polymerase, sigma-24 subunit, ECF subfamily (plasmid) [Emticicia oligotrophica DSM 17448]|uniref:RNA polymerase, sigma-24 subunit, ECF subfamily n=1 Tax=Emticicia oligotrophica (strain DSM 17448 / CIP 109782 / MTCC 6937 / GPTSA100-15) TaxID=929562 RepID=A0ABM5N842_EMTOG|nr:sigma-70 family RNA polymerase sigma factor [Emticicia oligotrophica]AFK05669.1 RNA polymerase, sigma-24 subunit, ECF subfamily [Emticicia oligotrophica DSM 17448]